MGERDKQWRAEVRLTGGVAAWYDGMRADERVMARERREAREKEFQRWETTDRWMNPDLP